MLVCCMWWLVVQHCTVDEYHVKFALFTDLIIILFLGMLFHLKRQQIIKERLRTARSTASGTTTAMTATTTTNSTEANGSGRRNNGRGGELLHQLPEDQLPLLIRGGRASDDDDDSTSSSGSGSSDEDDSSDG